MNHERLIVRFTTSNEIEYWDHQKPVVYVSREQFEYDFLELIEKHYKEYQEGKAANEKVWNKICAHERAKKPIEMDQLERYQKEDKRLAGLLSFELGGQQWDVFDFMDANKKEINLPMVQTVDEYFQGVEKAMEPAKSIKIK